MHEAALSDCADIDANGSGTARRQLKVFYVMPRAMYFGAAQATSIDLCVRDLIKASRFARSAHVIAEAVPDAFEGVALHPFPHSAMSATRSRAQYVTALASAHKPDVIVVQQHLPTASAIARRCPQARIVLQTHNFQKADYAAGSLKDWLRRGYKLARYKRLAGLIHVSEACRRTFAANWPDVALPQAVVHNGLDFGEWTPAEVRSREIVFAGRCVADKGALEGAQAVARTLGGRPDWTARFILSAVRENAAFFETVRSALAPLGARMRIEVQRPFPEVKAAYETAMIALVPSKVSEAFGRTALEAHAGGAGVISSGIGGLREVSGPSALYLPDVTADAIAAALDTLIDAPDLCARLARDGAAWVRERFSIESQAARLDSFCLGLRTKDQVPRRGLTNFWGMDFERSVRRRSRIRRRPGPKQETHCRQT